MSIDKIDKIASSKGTSAKMRKNRRGKRQDALLVRDRARRHLVIIHKNKGAFLATRAIDSIREMRYTDRAMHNTYDLSTWGVVTPKLYLPEG